MNLPSEEVCRRASEWGRVRGLRLIHPSTVFGGHDIASVPLWKKAGQLAGEGFLSASTVTHLREELAAVDQEICPVPPHAAHATSSPYGRRCRTAATTARLARPWSSPCSPPCSPCRTCAFEGFPGRRTRTDLAWNGRDSAPAAPLILDLARPATATHDAARAGALPGPAFKDAIGPVPHGLAHQWGLRRAFASGLRRNAGPGDEEAR
ncbi:hypothetical protein EDD27_1425 [Nonomuraea polychroma]|uniref:Uncharacterized protein n=1 Tax=Nonomuraea polychroma TaxID=46176 RepID=A0A438M0E3_9ACTN|nr:hypothetical protein [Nonomuraea polychroma]RVX39087.1 hypothetical protein EDD27_1425 [Nonomuraea polychroma]